jgi:hypothetical protein
MLNFRSSALTTNKDPAQLLPFKHNKINSLMFYFLHFPTLYPLSNTPLPVVQVGARCEPPNPETFQFPLKCSVLYGSLLRFIFSLSLPLTHHLFFKDQENLCRDGRSQELPVPYWRLAELLARVWMHPEGPATGRLEAHAEMTSRHKVANVRFL